MGENPPGEQDLLFIFLKALEVYSAGETTNLISSAEMLKRERKKKKKEKKTQASGGKQARKEEGWKEKMQGSLSLSWLCCLLDSTREERGFILAKHSPVPWGRLFSISSRVVYCKKSCSALTPLSAYTVDLMALIPSPQLRCNLSM